MSLGLKVPDNPAQFWEVDNAAEAGAALDQSAKQAGGSIMDKFGSFFSGAAGGAMSSLASATPYGAIANVVGSAIKDAPLTQTAESGRGGQSIGAPIYIVNGKGNNLSATQPAGPFNPWLIGGMLLAGLFAIKIMRG